MLNDAEKGLAIVRVASRSFEIEEKPWRYHLIPTGPTKRIKRARYVITSATDVRLASAEHKSPMVAVARQVVAMIARNTINVQKRPRSSGSRTYASRSCSVKRKVRTVETRSAARSLA